MNQIGRAILLSLLLACGSAYAADLYEVAVGSAGEATKLASMDIMPVMRTADGYLVLVEPSVGQELTRSGLSVTHITSAVNRDDLAIDMRRDRVNADRYPILYEQGDLRLFRVDFKELAQTERYSGLAPVRDHNIKIKYVEPKVFDWNSLSTGVDLDSLIDLVEKDSIISFTERMQAFYRRVSGTDSNAACADWIFDKFQEFGYDSVVSETFTDYYNDDPILFENVIAYKIGSMYPNRYIVIGGHRDAVPGSPGADDNASGTVSTMEMARVMCNIDSKVTLVFIAFDGEEIGIYGATHYADAAAARGDTILFMMNSDMIGHFENTDSAYAWYAIDSVYAMLWKDLADSLLNMAAVTGLRLSGSDHMAFLAHGYQIVMPDEWIFSNVYHSPRDSTTYLSFDYMTDMTKISLATVYAAMLDATMPALVFDYPSGVPRFVTPGDAIVSGLRIRNINGGSVIPESVTMHYSHNGAPYQTAPMNPMSYDLFECVIRDVLCGDTIDCYFTAEEAVTGLSFDSDSTRPLRLDVATQYEVVFDENFETGNGWTVFGTATDGHWECVTPTKTGPEGAPSEDFDGSGRCFLTDNDYVNPDVDGGWTALTSPAFDMSDGDGRIRYARWFDTYNYGQPDEDSLVLMISSDGGMVWTLVETVGPDEQASGGWYVHEFMAADFVTPAAFMKLRFIASDLGYPNRVEAAIDALLVASFECDYEPPSCGDADISGDVDIDDAVFLINFVFVGGPAPDPYLTGDVNCTDDVDIDDIVWLINYIFVGGFEPCDTDGDNLPDC